LRGETARLARRCSDHESGLEDRYPGCWDRLEQLRVSESGWPDWCLLPSIAGLVVVRGDDLEPAPWTPEEAGGLAPLGALFAWRWGRQIVRVDPDLAEALAATQLDRGLPADSLLSLPGWCLYLAQLGPGGQLGAYVFLDWNPDRQVPELVVVVDYEDGHNLAVAIDLAGESLADGVEKSLVEARHTRATMAKDESWSHELVTELDKPDSVDRLEQTVKPLVATVLYLCSAEPDVVDPSSRHDKLRKPPRPATTPVVWELGWRVGAKLRSARSVTATTDSAGSHARPRPHIRAAHWHHYWTGPRRGDRQLVVRWVHPFVVAGNRSELATTVRDLD
jgi:hypothetical protein